MIEPQGDTNWSVSFPDQQARHRKPVVLIQPKQADTMKGKNVVIGEPRPKRDAESTPSHKVVVEKLLDGEETIMTTIRGSTMGSHARKAEVSTSARNDGRQGLAATG
jgi:hypothetical protein